MSLVRFATTFVVFCAMGLVSGGAGLPTTSLDGVDASSLVRFIERRASSTDFAALEAFGHAALRRNDREGLNRLYHVTWTLQNQGDFARAATWNARLQAAARRQGDGRYLDIARLNAVVISGDSQAGGAAEIDQTARTGRDWFVRAHAARISALTLIAQGRIGEGLERLTEAEAGIQGQDTFARTARAGIWEVAGMGLRELHDVEGAAAAFNKFEIEFSNPGYPRPDFDSVYNLATMAVQIGDLDRAQAYYATHSRLTQRSGLSYLRVYDAGLCAAIADARHAPREVLACLDSLGEDLMSRAALVAREVLPIRAVARAETGDLAGARRDLAMMRQDPALFPTELARAEAELLFAEGRSAEGFAQLRASAQAKRVLAARTSSANIHQVTGNLQKQLAERRRQLDTARANTALQQGIIVIAVIFLLFAAAFVIWRGRQTEKVRAAHRRAEDASRAKSEFLANMSHEIRTPLNGVISMADTLARRELRPEELQMAELIRSSGATLERLLSDILDTAKIEASQVTLEPVPFDPRQLAGDVAALWSAKAEEQGVVLEVVLDPALPALVQGDVVRLRQVLTNLVSNALKFTASGVVQISIDARDGDRIAFRVKDTGIGFDAEQKSRIFQRFQQADGSITRRYGGTGLGLAISSSLVELMGGELDCESTPGEGATFFFDAVFPSVEASSDSPVIQTAISDMALRVLLADDHPANRKVIEIMLAGASIDLVTVENGREAVDAFVGGGFDLVLMDMQMPVMDGLTATAAIRAHEAEKGWPRTPLLMLTANAMAEHVEAGRQAGSDGHVTKPVTLDRLFDAIRTAVNRAEEPAAACSSRATSRQAA